MEMVFLLVTALCGSPGAPGSYQDISQKKCAKRIYECVKKNKSNGAAYEICFKEEVAR